MADRFPLILNTSANQIQEIASGDSLDLTGSNVKGVGILTAGNVIVGAATTDLIVNGDARITGILTIGTSSLKLDGPNNLVNVGTALTLGHSQGLQFHTQNLHSAGFEVNQINVSGASTIGGNLDANGDLDVDGHTNLDNLSVAGVSTFAGNSDFSAGVDVTGHATVSQSLTVTGTTSLGETLNITGNDPNITFVDSNNNPDFKIFGNGGTLNFVDSTSSANRLVINSDGHVDIPGNLDCGAGIDVTGNATVSGNLSVGGVLTYEDVTNVDSVGLITARNGINLTGGNITLGDTSDGSSDDLLIFGAGSDLKIYHDSNHSYIQNATGDLFIKSNADDLVLQAADDVLIRPQNGEDGIKVIGDGGVELYNNGTKKFETDGNGITVQGNINMATDSTLQLGVGNDFKLFHNGTTNFIRSANGNIQIDNNSGVVNAKFIPGGSSELYYNGTKHFETISAGLNFAGSNADQLQWQKSNNLLKFRDGTKAVFGEGDDLQIHGGEGGTGAVINSANGDLFFRHGSEEQLILRDDGAVELYHDNLKRFETSADGCIFSGPTNTTASVQIIGTEARSAEIRLIADDGDDYTDTVRLHQSVNGNFYLQNLTASATFESMLVAAPNGAVELYYDNSKKLETHTNGVDIFGRLLLGDSSSANDNRIRLGADGDLSIYHDGSNSYVANTTGTLLLQSTATTTVKGTTVQFENAAGSEVLLKAIQDGAVELYYDNSKKLETTNFGAQVVHSSGGGSIPIFKTLHGNLSQGIGLGYNGISAIGTNTNVELFLKPKGTSALYIQRDNGANMLRANPGAELILYHNGEETAQTYNTNGRKAFLVGDKANINNGIPHGELIVRKNLASPNNASIEQCARMTVITNEQTAGGNGYGGAVFFGAQDVSTTNQYTYRLGAIGSKLHASADLANTTPNGDFSVFCQHSSLQERFRVRHDGYIYATHTTVQSLSDIRLKENIEDYSFDLDKFKQFKPITFNWKKPDCHTATPKSGKHRGFIAQDVQKLDSYDLISEYDLDKDSEERQFVDEDGIGLTSSLGDKDAMYISVIQQMIDKIEKLETEVASLKGS